MSQVAGSAPSIQPHGPLGSLDSNSHTAQRLLHATPEHLFITTRRCFIGPIPEGWLLHHRKSWYKHHFHIHYSSRKADFAAKAGFGRHRRLTGLDGPSTSATHGYSFPQPDDVEDEDDIDEAEDAAIDAMDGNDPDQQATTAMPPAVAVPRSSAIRNDETAPQNPFEEPAQHTSQDDDAASGQRKIEEADRNGATEHKSDSQPIEANHNAPTSSSPNTAVDSLPQESHSPGNVSDDLSAGRLETSNSGARPSHTSSELYPTISITESSNTTTQSYGTPLSHRSSAETVRMAPLKLPEASLSSTPRSNSPSKSRSSRRVSTASFVTAREGSEDEDADQDELTPVATRTAVGLDGNETSGNTLHEPGKSPLAAFGTTSREARPPMDYHSSAMSLLRHINDHDESIMQPSPAISSINNPNHDDRDLTGETSAISLLRNVQDEVQLPESPDTAPKRGILRKLRPKTRHVEPAPSENVEDPLTNGLQPDGAVRFDVPDEIVGVDPPLHVERRRRKRALRRLRRGIVHDGEIVKMEKMLVRIEYTTHEVPSDFDENDSPKIESRIEKRWREYMVVCRQSASEDMDFVLQFYDTRAIPTIEGTTDKQKKKSTHNIELRRGQTNINLFSSLDKTMVLWFPYRKITRLFIMQPAAGSNSMEWYTFLRGVLGKQRIECLQVNVPSFGVSLRLENPFAQVEASRTIAQETDGADEAIMRTMREEQAAAGRIVDRCMDMLGSSSEWGDIVRAWSQRGLVGLAWKKYDRLEWIHGANERKMYGTMAMTKSHDLELRPKQHYPTAVRKKGGDEMIEPPPVEGFLIRLTSQRGLDQKLGRLFYKRLYFSTHNHFLIFNRPAAADPPPPPRLPMQQDHRIPTAHEIADKIPLIYSVNPYPVKDGKIEWLNGDADAVRLCDNDAEDEQRRQADLLLNCDGAVDLCRVVHVRDVHRGATAADENVDEGSDVDFDQEVSDSHQDDGVTTQFDDNRTFELVMQNGLVARLQAFDKVTKREWMKRLRALVKYWRLRSLADTNEFKAVRKQNLERLKIDEDLEAFMGQFARKWEVTNSYASPELYHMCGLSKCRSMVLSGLLFRKTRLRAPFSRSLVILSQGHLIIFRDSVRSRSGHEQLHIHHEKVARLDLRNCYVYSGLLTEGNLLYTAGGTTADGAHRPGHNALPRMYNDGWTSTDEDSMTCFVLWHNNSKGWFRSHDETIEGRGEGGHRHLRLVSRLGVEGKSIVFKTRSRAERDHWVMSIATEIERLASREEVRLVGTAAG